jgi:hypothetical protein
VQITAALNSFRYRQAGGGRQRSKQLSREQTATQSARALLADADPILLLQAARLQLMSRVQDRRRIHATGALRGSTHPRGPTSGQVNSSRRPSPVLSFGMLLPILPTPNVAPSMLHNRSILCRTLSTCRLASMQLINARQTTERMTFKRTQ